MEKPHPYETSECYKGLQAMPASPTIIAFGRPGSGQVELLPHTFPARKPASSEISKFAIRRRQPISDHYIAGRDPRINRWLVIL